MPKKTTSSPPIDQGEVSQSGNDSVDDLEVPITVEFTSSVPPPAEPTSQVTRVDEEVVRRAEQSILMASRPSDRPGKQDDSSTSDHGGESGKSRYADRYELVGLLGVGGMGSVYRVKDLILNEEVALKILRKDLADSPKAIKRFRKEVRLTRRITHPNVVRIYDIGQVGQEHFYTMECILGDVLGAHLSQNESHDLEQALRFGVQLTAGVQAMHAKGVIHRDLKPDNIIVSRDGRVVITDLGVAVVADDPQVDVLPMRGAGTPRYMAPEQIEGRHISKQTDLYALGLMLYELLTGRLPWATEDDPEAMARLSVPAESPKHLVKQVPDDLALTVMSLLEREPSQRPSSADIVLERLQLSRGKLGSPPSSKLSRKQGDTTRKASRRDIPAITTTNMPHQRSVGVLSFRNLGNPTDNYIAQAMTSALIENLIVCPAVRVAKRFTLGSNQGSLVLAGKQAGVDIVVEGSINRHASGKMSVSVRAIEVERGFILWSERFVRPTNKMFGLQSEITAALADVLALQYSPDQREQGPSNPENVDAFVRGQEAYGTWTMSGLQTALDLFTEAHDRSPDDLLLQSYIALSRLRLWHLSPSPDQGLASSAQQVAQAVIDENANVGEAQLALGVHAFYNAHWISAARRLEEAVRCNPALADAHWLLGHLHLSTGNTDEGVAMLDVALRINPQHIGALWELAYAMGMMGNLSRARDYLSRVEEQQPGHPSTVVASARIGNWAEDRLMQAAARDLFETMHSNDFPSMGHIAKLLLSTDPDLHVGHLTAVAAYPFTPPAARTFMMEVLAEHMSSIGRPDEAWAGVRAASTHSINTAWFSSCPALLTLNRPAVLRSLQSHVKARASQVFGQKSTNEA